MNNCPHCGMKLKLTPNEQTFNRNKWDYASWLRGSLGKFDTADKFTVAHLVRMGWSAGVAYKRVKILIRHRLIRLVHRGQHGGLKLGTTVGNCHSTPNVYSLTERGIQLMKEGL